MSLNDFDVKILKATKTVLQLIHFCYTIPKIW